MVRDEADFRDPKLRRNPVSWPFFWTLVVGEWNDHLCCDQDHGGFVERPFMAGVSWFVVQGCIVRASRVIKTVVMFGRGMQTSVRITKKVSVSWSSKIMKRLFQTVLAGAMFLVAAPANAAVVSFDFSADIGVVDAGLAAAGFNAPTITGTLTYDTVGVDASPNPNRGQYSTSTREFSFSNAVGDIAGSLTGGTIVIENDARDSFGFRTGIGFGLGTMGDVPGYQLRDIALFLEDQDGLTFSDIGLPAELDLADFTSERIFSFRYIEIATGDSVFAAGEITSLVPAPAAVIPLPASLPLLVAGLGFVFALRRRGQPLA